MVARLVHQFVPGMIPTSELSWCEVSHSAAPVRRTDDCTSGQPGVTHAHSDRHRVRLARRRHGGTRWRTGLPQRGLDRQGIEFDEAAYEIKGREQDEAAAVMLGRVSYEAFSPVWPGMTAEFPGHNAMPKYVVSTTLQEQDLVSNWGEISILRSLDDVAALKQTNGGPVIVHGSATLNRNLSDAGLIDRYHLLVFPVLLGAGKRLFSETDKDKQSLKVIESGSYRNGIQTVMGSERTQVLSAHHENPHAADTVPGHRRTSSRPGSWRSNHCVDRSRCGPARHGRLPVPCIGVVADSLHHHPRSFTAYGPRCSPPREQRHRGRVRRRTHLVCRAHRL